MGKADSGPRSYPGHLQRPAKPGPSQSEPPFLPDRTSNSRKPSPHTLRSTWKFHLHPFLPSSSKFFHLMQLFSREASGFVVALGFVQNKIRIASQLPPSLGPDGNSLPLPEIPVEQYWGRTVHHRCVVRWGQGGSVDCEFGRACCR